MRSVIIALALAALLRQSAADDARRLYERGAYGESAEAFAGLAAAASDDPRLRYNLGTALLLAEAHDEARVELARAGDSGKADVAQPAAYNRGNADLFPAFRQPSSPERRERLLRAVAAYREALLLDPGDSDARWNLELAQRLLREESPPTDDESPAGGGGGGESTTTGREGDPTPQPAEGAGSQPRLAPEQAERLVAAAQERELGTQQEKLRRPQPAVLSH